MKKNILRLLMLFCLISTIVACSDSSNDDKKILDTSLQTLEFDSESSSLIFDIKSNLDWNLKVEDGWCRVEPNASKNNGSVKVYIDENENEVDRTTKIFINASGTLPKVLIVHQKGYDRSKIKIDSPILGNWYIIDPNADTDEDNDNLDDDSEETVEASPIILNWKLNRDVEESEYTLKIGTLPALTVSQASELGKMALGSYLGELLHKIEFLEYGDINVEYQEMGVDEGTPWLESGIGLVSYRQPTATKFDIKLYADEIIKKAGIEEQAIQNLMRQFMVDLYPINYRLEGEQLTLFIDKDLAVKLLKLAEPFKEVMPEDMAGFNIKATFENIIEIFKVTDTIEFGIVLHRTIK